MRALAATCFSKAVARVARDVRCRMPDDGNRRAYLTFDDGPTPDGTSMLCDVLAEHGVPALFFLVGQRALAEPAQVRRLLDAGHQIGNHSHSHVDAWRTSPTRVVREMERCTRVLEDMTSRRLEWVRPPYGRVTPSLLRWCRRRQQQMLLWDVMPADFEPGADPRRLAAVIEGRIRSGSVVCLHDNAASRRATPAALRICLPRLKAAGWTLALPSAGTPFK